MRRLDGIYHYTQNPEVRRQARRFGVIGVIIALFIGLVSNASLPGTTLGETGSASNARLWSSGAELNSTTADIEVSGTSGTMSISGSTKRSGDYAYRANPTSSTGTFYKTWAASAQSNKFWFRTYVWVTTAPGAETKIFTASNAGSNRVGVRMNTDRTIELWNEEDGTQIGSASAALSLNSAWHRVELYVNTSTPSDTDAELRLDGTSVASCYTSCSSINLANGIERLTWGIITTSTTADLFFDDIAINDSTGRTDNWPGEGKIVHMNPDADGDNVAWTASAGSDYDTVNEVTPDTADYIYSQTLNQIDDLNLESSTNAGMTAGDTIKLVSAGVHLRPCGNASAFPCTASETDPTYNLRVKASSGGTTEDGTTITMTNSTTYYTNDDDTLHLNNLTTYDLPGTSTAKWTTADLDTAQVGIKNTDTAGIGFRVATMWLQVEYVAAASGRVWSNGFELQSTTADMSYTANIGTTPVVDTTNFRGGAAALQTSASAATSGWEYDFAAANAANDYYFRAYIRVATAPGVLTNIMEFYDSANTVQASIRMNTDRTLELWNDEDTTQIGSDSSAIAATTWTRLEIRLNCSNTCTGAAGDVTLDARINGSSFASSSVVNHANGVMTLRAGVLTSTTADFSWDDVALNQGIGTSNNSWPGDGKIVHLKPNGNDATNAAWTNTYTNVDETTPNDATDLISSTTTGDIEDYDVEDATFGDSATVNVVSVGVRFNTVAATEEDFRTRLTGGTGGVAIESPILSPASTTWVTNQTASPYLYQNNATTQPGVLTAWNDTALDSAQIGVRDIAGSGTIQVTALWLLVEYIPPTITISGSCDQYDQTTDCSDDIGNEIRFAVNGVLDSAADGGVD